MLFGIEWLGFDALSAIIFVIILGIVCYVNRDKLDVQKIAFPFLYIVMYRTKLGIKLMDKLVKKFGEAIKLYGYIAIGMGFIGMFLMTFLIVLTVIKWIVLPVPDEMGFALVLPFTDIPGIGYLSFWYFIISIFILAVVHEFAHGVVARAHKLDIKSTGFAMLGVIFPILPAAFVEPDEKKLKKANDVVQYSVFAAGPVINILIAVFLLILMPYVGQGALYPEAGVLAPFEDRVSEPVGFSYILIDNASYPAMQAGMPNSSIINSVNGQDVDTYYDFQIEMLRVRPGEEIVLGTQQGTFDLTTIENPSMDRAAFIGVYRVENERAQIIEDWKYETFHWFKGLFKWIFTLNFFVGLFNLLPLLIVDGGRMFNLAVERIFSNSKKMRQRLISFFAIFLLLAIILGMIVNYIGNPFLLFQ